MGKINLTGIQYFFQIFQKVIQLKRNSKVLRMLEDASLLCNDKFLHFKKLDFNLKLWKILKQSANKCFENWHEILHKTILCYDSKIWQQCLSIHITKQSFPSWVMFLLFENGLNELGGKITLWNITNIGLFRRLWCLTF